MRRKRKGLEVFGLSFLDCICCGFGGVILLYTMTTLEDGVIREGITNPARAEVSRIEERMEDGKRLLAEIRNSLEDEERKLAEKESQTEQLQSKLKEDMARLTQKTETAEATLKHANLLKSDIESVKQEIVDLKNVKSQVGGGSLVSKTGGGRQHYITGLKVTGDRPVILLDCSASTVAESLALYKQFYQGASNQQLLTAPKRVRMLDALDWLVATSDSPELQIILYNQKVNFALSGTQGQWIQRTDSSTIQAAVDEAWNIVPGGGADLEGAIELASSLKPKPDNIYLITDGLPTYSPSVARGNPKRFFQQALKKAQASSLSIHVFFFLYSGIIGLPPCYGMRQ